MVAVVEMGNHSVVVHQGGHELEGLASKRDLDYFSSWGYMYWCMGIGWWFALTNKIFLIRKHLSCYWNGKTLLTHMLS